MRAAAAAAGVALLLGGCVTGTEEPPPAPEGTLVVFAAASLSTVFDELAVEFERLHPGVDVVLQYAGSSALAIQLIEGAPADVFASASAEAMAPVVEAGVVGRPADFAANALQLAVPPGNPGRVTGLADLARPELAVALCAVEVPCGALTARVLEDAGVEPSVDTYEQDVTAVLTRIALDEADAGLVYRTDVLAAGDRVEGIELPESADAVTVYQVATVHDAANPIAAAAFVQQLTTTWRDRLAEAGFDAR